ncbi:MAG: type 4a pilus biogenesis protein PilO [Planctomycetes bacterium]|nr:type 4a pilus biogenesis protein PilO [Planctomycetota bacterium]
MAKLNEKQRIFAFVGGGVLLCMLACGGAYWASGLVDEKKLAIENDEKAIQAAEAKIDRIIDLEKDVIVLRENVDAYTQILPDESEVNNFVRTTNVFATKSGVRIDSFLKGAEGKRGKYKHYSYRLQLQGTLWEFLEFVNLFENHPRFVRVVSFSVKPADNEEIDRAAAQGQDPVHTYTLVVETYVYGERGSSGGVEIPKYEQRCRELRDRIAQERRLLPLENYQLSEVVGRRDIFVDPRPRVGGLGQSDNPRGRQLKTVRDYQERIGQLVELHGRWKEEHNYLLQQRLEHQLVEQLETIDREVGERSDTITDAALHAEWTQTVLTPVRDMLREVEGREREPANRIGVEQIEALVAEMRALVERGEFEAAISKHDEMRERLAFTEDDPRFAAAVGAEKLRLAVEAALDFSGIQMDIRGVVVFEEGRRGLLLNGRVYEEGDYVQDDLLLATVRQEEAEFVFRGFRLAKKW